MGWLIELLGAGATGREPGVGLAAAEVAQLGGGTDTLTVIGMAHLQQGATREAAEVLDAAAAALGPDAGAVAVAVNLGFVRLAEGRVDEAAGAASKVLEDARTSYLDRTMAWLVTGLAAARRHDHTALVAAFAAARLEADGSGDVLTQALARLAEGRARDVVGDGGAADLTAEAWARLNELGIDGAGWLTVFDLSLGLSAQVAPDRT